MVRRADDDGGLRFLFHEHLPGHWTAVETGVSATGVPDSNFCVAGVEGWVEYKRSAHHQKIEVRPAQSGWLFRRWREGGRCYVAIRVRHDGGPRKGRAVDELHICEGIYAPQLIKEGLTSVPSLVFSGGPQRWDWTAVLRRLTRPER